MKKVKKFPDFSFESDISPAILVIGIDEVGRGCLAGPVVAAAVFIETSAYEYFLGKGIDDSKRLNALKREEMDKIIKERALWGIGQSSVSYINRNGIVKATERAMRIAIKEVVKKSGDKFKYYLLIDAFNLRYVPSIGLKNQKAITKGDQKSISIASASIIAKVYRDNLMKTLDKKYPVYGWDENKGYGTKQHLLAIKQTGVCKLHRLQFVSNLF